MEHELLIRKVKGEKIFFSELLADPPSDEILAELFPYGRKNAFFITQTALKVLNLKLNGLNVEAIGAKLNLTRYQVYGRLKNVGLKLVREPIPDYIELDIPALRKMCGMDVPTTGGYTKVSELLRDMPSEQELLEFAASRGNVPGFGDTRPINRSDLLLLQKKVAGRRNADIARELGVSGGAIHQRLTWIRRALKKMGVQIDMPELFPHERTNEPWDSSTERLSTLNQEKILNTPSVEVEELVSHGFSVSRVWVQSEQAAEDLKKPCGLYITINTGPLDKLENFEEACACLVEQLQPLLAPYFGKSLCICGIGCRDYEFDSLGPEVAKRISPKTYEAVMKESNFETIAMICPDVSAHTNLSSESIISSIVSGMNAACVLTVDSSSCGDLDRLCSSIQLTNAGMQTYKENMQFRKSSLGVPVISIGVPTAIGANSLSEETNCAPDLFLTPSHVSDAVRAAAFVIACAVSQIAYPDLDYNNCKQCIGLFLTGIA